MSMKKHAGSAFMQNVGYMDFFNDWKPFSNETKWLLLSGASDPPRNINVSERRPRENPGARAGVFLHGVTRDITSMTDALVRNKLDLFNSVQNIRSTKEEALKHIEDLYNVCKSEKKAPVIYYTGHGEVGTGNWCFRNGTIDIEELCIVSGCYYPLIISDCCFSGNWADYCLNRELAGYHCLAACPHFNTALDISTQGGELTLFMTGQRGISQMSRMPLYSGNNDEVFPYRKTIYSKDDFFNAHLKNNNYKLVCHTMANNKISALFVTRKTESSSRWSYSTSYKDFIKSLRKNWREGYRCASFSCDDNGILVYCEKNYGTEQRYFYGNGEVIEAEIIEGHEDGMIITGCGSCKSLWIIIMTKGLPDSDKEECCTIERSWNECVTYINNMSKTGFRSKGVYYNLGLKQYFIFMRKTGKGNVSTLFDEGYVKEARNWIMENYRKNYRVDFMFKNPTTDNTLIHMEITNVINPNLMGATIQSFTPVYDLAFYFVMI